VDTEGGNQVRVHRHIRRPRGSMRTTPS